MCFKMKYLLMSTVASLAVFNLHSAPALFDDEEEKTEGMIFAVSDDEEEKGEKLFRISDDEEEKGEKLFRISDDDEKQEGVIFRVSDDEDDSDEDTKTDSVRFV